MIAGVLQLMDPAAAAPGPRWEIGGTVTLGRESTCDIVLAVPEVSRRHARVDVVAARCVLTDDGSRNGTTVNGEPLGERRELIDGDELVLGGAVALRFIDPMATPIAPRIGRLSGVWIDPHDEMVYVDANPVDPPLSARQFALVRRLYDAENAVVSRADIVADVWADVAADGVTDDAVTALTKRVRGRLRDTGVRSDPIEIVRGRGIRLRQGG